MEYKPQHSTDCSLDIDAACNGADLNFKHLAAIDKEAKDKNELLHRFFQLPVADGVAYYQITKVTKNLCKVTRCEGICLDEYADNILGDGDSISRTTVEKLIRSRDILEKIIW